jgi:hypothetical protein
MRAPLFVCDTFLAARGASPLLRGVGPAWGGKSTRNTLRLSQLGPFPEQTEGQSSCPHRNESADRASTAGRASFARCTMAVPTLPR